MSHLNITYNPDYSSTPIREVCSIYITKNQAGERNKNVPNDNGYDFFFKLGFTPCKAEQPLRGMQLQEKKKHKKDYRLQKICLERT